jgi:hypothetical protein
MVFLKNLSRFQDWHQFKVQHGVYGAKTGAAAPMYGVLGTTRIRARADNP